MAAILIMQRTIAPKAHHLVLMMTNSCSYSTNDLVVFKDSDFDQDLNWYLASLKSSKSSLKLTHGDTRPQTYRTY